MTCHHDKIADDSPQPASVHISFPGSIFQAKRFLADHTENVVSQNSQFQHKLICFELTGREPLDIHIRLDLTMELLTFTMCMIEINDIRIGQPKICSPGIDLNVTGQKKLAIFIKRSFNNLISGTNTDCIVLMIYL